MNKKKNKAVQLGYEEFSLKKFRENGRVFFSRPWVFPLVILLGVLTLGLPKFVAPIIKKHYYLGVDLQEYKCLPYTMYGFVAGRVGVEHAGIRKINLNYGKLVSFIERNNVMQMVELEGKRIVKKVAALPGDVFEVSNDVAYINGVEWGELTLLKSLEKPSGFYDRKLVVPDGEVLLLGTTDYSYDGRYYGFLDQSEINAIAIPLF